MIFLTLVFYYRLTRSSTAMQIIFKFADCFIRAIIKKTLTNMCCHQVFQRKQLHNILFSPFFWGKKHVFIQNALTLLLGCILNLAFFPSLTKVFIIQFIFPVFLKTKCWQHEVTINLDSILIKTGDRRILFHFPERGLDSPALFAGALPQKRGANTMSSPILQIQLSLCA